MSHHFNLHPPDIWDLTPDEIQPYLKALEAIAKERREAERKSKRRRR